MAEPIHRRTTGTQARLASARLSLRGPVLFGFGVIALLLGGGFTAASIVPIDKGASLSGTIVVETKTKPVQHGKGGTVGKLHVNENSEVKAGDLILTFDTSSLEEQIGALKAQADAARRQLELVRMEVATMSDLFQRQLAQRSRLLALERQAAELEKENLGFKARIAVAEQERDRAEVRATVDGRLLSLSVRGPGEVVAAGAVIAEIVPQDERLIVEGRLSPALIDLVRTDQRAKVWLAGLSWRDARPLPATVLWISPDSVEDRRTGLSFFKIRIALDAPRSSIARSYALHPGQRAEILVLTGERTLLDQLLDPIMRNINRAFRA